MASYLARRLLLAVLLVLTVSSAALVLSRLAPGDYVTDTLGIDADAKEAVSFAILAYATIRGLANNVPSATGADEPVILGKIVPGR